MATKIQKTDNKSFILRDRLASERTVLANERTVLAYIRTAFAVIIGGVFFIKLLTSLIFQILGWLLIIFGFVIFLWSFTHYRQIGKYIKKIEEK